MMVVEEGPRERHARQIGIDKFKKVLHDISARDSQTGFCQRKYVQCTSGVRETGLPALALVNSGNVAVDKCIMAFASLALEVDILLHEARSNVYNSLLLYGEDADEVLLSTGTSRAGIAEMMSNFLPCLLEISSFVGRCHEVGANILRQLHAFFNLPSEDFSNARDRHLTCVWLCLGDVLGILATLDEVVRSHPVLAEHWKVYMESVQIVQHNTSKFDISAPADSKKLRTLLGVIAQIQSRVIGARTFEIFCRHDFGTKMFSDSAFLDRFQRVILEMLTNWERLARHDMPDKKRLVLITCLTVFHCRLMSRNVPELLDKKLGKALWDTQKRIITFHFVGDILWTPLEFLVRSISDDALVKAGIPRRSSDALKSAKNTLFERQLEALPKEVESVRESIGQWKSEMRKFAEMPPPTSDLSSKASTDTQSLPSVGTRCVCVLKGARIADRTSRIIKYILNACVSDDRTLAKSNAHHIFRLIELVNVIFSTFNFHWPSVLEWTAHARNVYSARLLALLSTILEQFTSGSQRADPRVLDVTSALRNAILTLHDSPTRRRLVVAAVALEVANYQKVLRPAEVTRVKDLLSRLDALTNVGLLLSRVCDTSYLFWHRSLANIYFESALFTPEWPIENVKMFFDALNQCCASAMLRAARHCSPNAMRKLFQLDVFSAFTEKFLVKLCTEVETNLRLTCHQRQEISAAVIEQQLFPSDGIKSSTASTQPSVYDNAQTSRLVELLRPSGNGGVVSSRSLELRLDDRVINVREYVSARLDATFYNLTTVALHDSETYTRMRALARTRFSLYSLSDAHLPFMKVDQGLDVVMIARNIQIFVEQYAYDLIEQMFVERFNNSRALNVVQVEQVVNSIRTHGVGILSTLVHVVYQFLRKSFQVFSQFLHDEHVKSLLVKEIRYYRDHIDQLDQTYPMERAEALNALIRKIGTSNDGKSFLDKFRGLVTQVGNAIGLIRMFRTGMLESREYAASFVRDIDVDALTQMTVDGEPLSVDAAELLAGLIRNVNNTFDNADDFIEKLIAVFAREFRNHEKYAHLRNFFILIPALCVNFAEHIFACRNRLGKQRAAADADFTFVDDGFCFGTAYILRLLNQGFFFDSLKWFESVRVGYAASLGGAEAAVHTAQRSRARDDSLAQALSLKLGRTRELLHNYEHLEYTLTAALIFFRVKESSGPDDSHSADEDEAYLEEF